MLQPSPHEEIATLDTESHVLTWCLHELLHSCNQLGGHALISVDVEHPGILERDVAQAPILVSSPVVEWSLRHGRARGLSDRNCVIGAAGVVHMNVVRPRDTLQTARQVLLF